MLVVSKSFLNIATPVVLQVLLHTVPDEDHLTCSSLGHIPLLTKPIFQTCGNRHNLVNLTLQFNSTTCFSRSYVHTRMKTAFPSIHGKVLITNDKVPCLRMCWTAMRKCLDWADILVVSSLSLTFSIWKNSTGSSWHDLSSCGCLHSPSFKKPAST